MEIEAYVVIDKKQVTEQQIRAALGWGQVYLSKNEADFFQANSGGTVVPVKIVVAAQ